MDPMAMVTHLKKNPPRGGGARRSRGPVPGFMRYMPWMDLITVGMEGIQSAAHRSIVLICFDGKNMQKPS